MASEPMTQTGKRLWANKRTLMVPADLIAIEAEAREQERALADELGKALDECRIDLWDDWGEAGPRASKREVEAALAKWEASR